MKRPLFVAGVTMFSALGCLFHLQIQNGSYIIATIGVLAVAAVYGRIKKWVSGLWVAATVPLFIGLILYFWQVQQCVLPVAALEGCCAQVTAQVVSAPEWGVNHLDCLVQTQSVALEGVPQGLKMLLRVYELEDVAVGDTLQAMVTFEKIDHSYYAEGVYILGTTPMPDAVQAPNGSSVLTLLEGFRGGLRALLRQNLPNTSAGYLQALLLGDKSALPGQFKSAYRICGLSHLLVVSGLHLSLLCGAAQKIFLRLGWGRRRTAAACMGLVVAVMAVTGFSDSILRAGCMHLLAQLGRLLFRRGDPLNFLGAALLIMLAVQPLSAGSLSLLLSAASVMSILLLSPYITAVFYRWLPWPGRVGMALRRLADVLAMTLSAGVATLPMQLVAFGEVSWLAVPANLLVVGVSGVVLLGAMAVLLVAALLPISGLTASLFWGLHCLAAYCTELPLRLSRLPFAGLYLDGAHIGVCVGVGLILVALGLLLRPTGVRGIFCLGLCGVLFCGSCFSYTLQNRHTAQIALFPSREGCSVVLTCGHTAAVMGLPAEACSEVYTYLRAKGINSLSLLVLPHTHIQQQPQARLLQAQMSVACTLTTAEFARVQTVQLQQGVSLRFYCHDYGAACRVQLGQRVCLVSLAGVDFTPVATAIGPVDVLVCGAAVPKGLVTRPSTVCLLGSHSPNAYLASAELARQGVTCYIPPPNAKMVAKFQKNGYNDYEILKGKQGPW